MLNGRCQSLGVKLKTVFVPNLNNLNSFLKAKIDSIKGKLKIQRISIQQGIQKQALALYDYSQQYFGSISSPSKTLTPRCYSPKPQLPEQTTQAKTFPFLPTVA